MKLHDLVPNPGSKKNRKRVGRGISAGQGKTAGRGTKGQGARSGEGDQREAGDRLVTEHHKRQAAVQGEGADGDGKRRQPQPGDQDAVDGTRHRAQDDAQWNDQLQRQAGRP